MLGDGFSLPLPTWPFDSDRWLAEAIDRRRIKLGNQIGFFPFEMLFRHLNTCISAVLIRAGELADCRRTLSVP